MRKGMTNNDLIKIRIQAVTLLTKGHGPSAIAEKLNLRRQTVTKWRRIYEEHKTRGLLSVKPPRTAQQSKLTEEEIKSLLAVLNGDSSTKKRTYRGLVALIYQCFNVTYSESGVRFLLKQRGYHINSKNQFEKIGNKKTAT